MQIATKEWRTYIEDIFVISKSYDKLYDQLSPASRYSSSSSPVGVLPVYTVILLMQTDNIWSKLRFAICPDYDAIEVLLAVSY